jgi:hypothetical protein
MKSSSLNNSSAVIIDKDGRFVDFLGQVVSRGRVLRTVDGTIIRSFDLRRLQADLEAEQYKLAYLAPGQRLPKSQVRDRESLYRRLDQS